MRVCEQWSAYTIILDLFTKMFTAFNEMKTIFYVS